MDLLFVHKNLWRLGTLAAPTSEHPQFPAMDTQVDNLKQTWRSRYGTGSGNGTFVVNADNCKLDFDEGGAELTATIDYSASHTGQGLADNIEYQLNLVGALTYTVTYAESTGKFTIAATGNFTLRWNTGTHKATDCSGLLGFLDTADDTGAATYTSDTRVNHTSDHSGLNDLGAAEQYDFIALIGHNLSSAAVITLHGADDTSLTNPVSDVITWTTGDIFFKLPATRTKQVLYVAIADPANTAGYIEIKTIVVGKSWVSNRYFTKGFARGPESHSTVQFSDSIVSHGQDKPRPKTWSLGIQGLNSASELLAEDLLDVCDILYGFLICLDATSAATRTANTYFVKNAAVSRPVNESYGYFNWSLDLREVQ